MKATCLTFIAALGLLGVAPVWALRPVQVYVVTVRNASTVNVVMEGMRKALVRATGRREAAANPLLAEILQNAARYVRATYRLGGGAVNVEFDGATLGPAIIAAGGSLWDSHRPFTLVAIGPIPNGAAGRALRVQLEQTAEARGLPVSIVPLAITDASGAPLPDAAVLQSAQALGADAVLIGRADSAASGLWQWHLLSSARSAAWSGAADAGINGAADALASMGTDSSSKPLVLVVVQVAGVATLADSARVEQLLRAVPDVQSSRLTLVEGTTATFTLGVRGGGEALLSALAGSPYLGRAGTGETQVQLNYQP